MDENHASPFFDRVKSGFWLQYNVILLAGAFFFAVALGSWTPVIVGAMAEMVWLALATSPIIHQKIEQRRAALRSAGYAAADGEQLRGLRPEYVSRFERLMRVVDQIRRARLDLAGVSPGELEGAIDKLDHVQRSFLRLAVIHQRGTKFLHAMPVADLERETARIGAAIAEERDLSIRMALRQSLALAQRRIRQREQMVITRRTVELQMATMEQAFLYLDSVVLDGGSAFELKEEIDAFTVPITTVDGLEAEADRTLEIGDASSQTYAIPIVLDSD